VSGQRLPLGQVADSGARRSGANRMVFGRLLGTWLSPPNDENGVTVSRGTRRAS